MLKLTAQMGRQKQILYVLRIYQANGTKFGMQLVWGNFFVNRSPYFIFLTQLHLQGNFYFILNIPSKK